MNDACSFVFTIKEENSNAVGVGNIKYLQTDPTHRYVN
jgi:hypothetical protein